MDSESGNPFTPIERCRVCASTGLFDVINLKEQPLANAFVRASDAPPRRFPLVALGCEGCGVVQLSGSVDPHLMFDEYAYFSSYSSSMVAAMRALAERTVSRERLGPHDLVVEVASNDGYLLRHYRDLGVRTLGIEPAANVAAAAVREGIETRVAYFSSAMSKALREEGLAPKVVHANNVIAHVPQVHDFVEGLRLLLAKDGVVILETPYLVDLIDHRLFDTIYHEHVFYWSLGSLSRLFAEHGLVLTGCERVEVHGGSLRASFRHEGAGAEPGVLSLLDEESERDLYSPDSFKDFAAGVERVGRLTRETFVSLSDAGRSVAGYGAAAKATVLLNYADVDQDLLPFVADLNPAKQGRLIPGTRIEIVSPAVLKEEKPDVIAVFVWNIAREIHSQFQWFVEAGGELLDMLEMRTAS